MWCAGSEPLTSHAMELSINGDRDGNDEPTNLTTYNVPALTEFFCSVFGFQLVEKRADKCCGMPTVFCTAVIF